MSDCKAAGMTGGMAYMGLDVSYLVFQQAWADPMTMDPRFGCQDLDRA